MSNSTPVQKQDYEVIDDGFVAGRRRSKGEIVPMSESEAQFLVLDGLVKLVVSEPEVRKSGKANAASSAATN